MQETKTTIILNIAEPQSLLKTYTVPSPFKDSFELFWQLAICLVFLSPFHPSITFHIETSHLFCRGKQITGFYMECNTGLKCVKPLVRIISSKIFNRRYIGYKFFQVTLKWPKKSLRVSSQQQFIAVQEALQE